MKSRRTADFNEEFSKLPNSIKLLANKTYRIWKSNHLHPSLHYKKYNEEIMSIRIGYHYRALAYVENGYINWYWIGTHEDYNKLFN